MSGESFWWWLAGLLLGAGWYLYWDWCIHRDKEEDPYSDDEGLGFVPYANRGFGAFLFFLMLFVLFLRLLGLY
jgi:hypothetical protein